MEVNYESKKTWKGKSCLNLRYYASIHLEGPT